MASASAIVFATTTMLLMVFYGASGHDEPAPAPGPSTDCFTVVVGLADCLSYVQEGSNITKPDKPCCPELKGLVDNNPVCLCYLLVNTDTFGIKIDSNRALKLPSVCKVDTPPPSLCSLAGYPVPGPTASHVHSPVAGYPVPGPTASHVHSPGPQLSEGSVSAPSPAATINNDKGGSNIAASCAIASLVALAIASLPTFF